MGVAKETQGLPAMRDNGSGKVKPNVSRKYLTTDEVHRLIDAAGKVGRQAEWDKLLLTLIYRHGLRVSEAVDLRGSDLDPEAPKSRTLHVRRLKGSKNSIHTLEPDTVRMLKRLHAETNGHYVFRPERGGPLSVDAVQLICKRAGEAASLPFRVHPHQLRHACGFYLAEEGVDTPLIQSTWATRPSPTLSSTLRRRLADWRRFGCADAWRH